MINIKVFSFKLLPS